MLVVLNIDEFIEEPISIKHISWFVQRYGNNLDIYLYEVVEASYHHPDAPNEMGVRVIETRFRAKAPCSSVEASAWILLEANLKVVSREGWSGKTAKQ